jgi:His-Xaa-Ser system radical SAM maturase HxsC
MIRLFSRQVEALSATVDEPFIVRVTENENADRRTDAFLMSPDNALVPEGFRAYLFPSTMPSGNDVLLPPNSFALGPELDHVAGGDVLRIHPRQQSISLLYRRASDFNSLLVTERCNHYCLMCSQPPKTTDDSYIVAELLQAIPLMSRETREIGITGGEPTLLGEDLLRLLVCLRDSLPSTAVHVLSNGRRFVEGAYARAYSEIRHPDLMTGIPLYSDLSDIHDYVVQADGAYDETIRGILNLKRLKQRVEIRIVIHKQTYERLPELARFIARNLVFADHVALMGLEMMGFTRGNIDLLWVDPFDYQRELVEAVQTLARANVPTSVYNHQLCVLDPELYPFNRKSISDWKNEYVPECEGCTKRSECGGFFSSSRFRYSSHIRPFA